MSTVLYVAVLVPSRRWIVEPSTPVIVPRSNVIVLNVSSRAGTTYSAWIGARWKPRWCKPPPPWAELSAALMPNAPPADRTAVVAIRDSLFMALPYPSRRIDDRDDTPGDEGRHRRRHSTVGDHRRARRRDARRADDGDRRDRRSRGRRGARPGGDERRRPGGADLAALQARLERAQPLRA